MMRRLTEYKTLVFDCDGVILNSNQLKIQAYFDVAIKFGASEQQAKALVDYHVALGGISRYQKFEFFLREILHQTDNDAAMAELLEGFTCEVKRLLSHCEISPYLENIRHATPHASWMVISGGDQSELREIFAMRGIDYLFDSGIFGSPDNKDEILVRELKFNHIKEPALFIGDSRYDHAASTRAGLDFLFLNGWTDFEDWQTYCATNKIEVLEHLGHLI